MVSEEFKRNVALAKVMEVRSALVDYLIMDRTFSKFDEALAEAGKTLKVVEAHDGRPFENDRSKWDETYLNRQKTALMINFSQERIDHLKAVIKQVLPEKARDGLAAGYTGAGKNKKTGKRVISETEIVAQEEKKADDKTDTGVIACGVAVAAVGAVAAVCGVGTIVGVGCTAMGAGAGAAAVAAYYKWKR